MSRVRVSTTHVEGQRPRLGVDALGEALSSNDVLQVLGLEGNRVGVDGVAELLEGLSQNRRLQELRLSGNDAALDSMLASASQAAAQRERRGHGQQRVLGALPAATHTISRRPRCKMPFNSDGGT